MRHSQTMLNYADLDVTIRILREHIKLTETTYRFMIYDIINKLEVEKSIAEEFLLNEV